MKIQAGKFYDNRTKKYLLPCISDHGKEFFSMISKVFPLAVGINDKIINKVLDNHIFILVSTESRYFPNVLKWIREQPFYEVDYPFDDVVTGFQHMIVLKLPNIYSESYRKFKEGKYSKMYTDEQMKKLFANKDISIFTRSENALKQFVDTVNEMYDVSIQYETWEGEVDFPPRNEEEEFDIGKG